MAKCTGRGFCLEQCCCLCFEDEECEVPSEVCTCGHRDHPKLYGGDTECDIYCRDECPYKCELIPCHNYKLCQKKLPQCQLDINNGMCLDCAVSFGKIKFLDIKDECPICMENKNMIQISCEKHNLCLDCWKEISKTSKYGPTTCPLCRESIWKWKKGK